MFLFIACLSPAFYSTFRIPDSSTTPFAPAIRTRAVDSLPSSTREPYVPRVRARMCTTPEGFAASGDNLSSLFSAEVARRQRVQKVKGNLPGGRNELSKEFSGIREVVLNDGLPTSIPKRPAPPPARSMEDETDLLFEGPNLWLGCFLSLGSAMLLVLIAGADSAASL